MAVGYKDKSVTVILRTTPERTFVCQIVKDVEVITAKRCPVREILNASKGSLSAGTKPSLDGEDACSSKRAERRR
jgi:hypothetical protein